MSLINKKKRQINLLIWVINALFIHVSSISACHSVTLHRHEARQTFTTYADTSDTYFNILEFDTTYYQYTEMAFFFNNGGLELSFYTEDPCLNKNATAIESFTISNNPTTLVWKPAYAFCKVTAISQSQVLYSIALKVKQDIEGCSVHKNKYNSIVNPADAGKLMVGQNCVETCNRGIRFTNPDQNISGLKPARKTKWVQYDNEFQTIVKIINQTTKTKARCMLYGLNDDRYFYINDVDLADQDSLYYQFTPYESILLGFYFSDNTEGDFSVCLQKYPITNTCIDFFGAGNGQKLEAVHTSKGSPVSGPYLMGEEVTFSYKVIEWMPINHNWIHGFYVQHGSGWKGFKKNEDSTKYLVNIGDNVVSIDSTPVMVQTNFVVTDSLRFPGVQVKSLKLPGFYVSNESRGPLGPSQNYRWGNNVKKVHGSEDSPLQEIFFTLVADSTGDCGVPLSATVFVQPLSDYETGSYSVYGCIENTPVEHQAQIVCCTSMATVTIADSTLCNGDIYNFPVSADYTGTWQIKNNPAGNEYNLNVQSFLTPLRVINNLSVPDTLEIEIVITDSTGCENRRNLTFIVKAIIQSMRLDVSNICKGEKVNISDFFSESIGTEIKFSENNDFSDTYRDNHNQVWLSGNEKMLKSYRIESNDFCASNSSIMYNPEKCLDNEQKEVFIDMDIFPNPAIDKANLLVSNESNSENWNLILLNNSNQIIWSRTEYIPSGSSFQTVIDLSVLPEGMYFVSLTDNKIILTKRLINIKP